MQPLPTALAQERAHGLPVSCASPGTVHISVANPVRQGLQPGQRGDGGLLRPAQEGVLARQGLVGLDPRPLHRGTRGLDRPIQYGEAQRCARWPHPGRVPLRAGKGRVTVQEIVRSPILAPLGWLLVGACLPQTLLGTSAANWNFKLLFANNL